MRINADFEQRAVVRFADTPWVPSPAAGVERKMLDRIGEEVARATTIVRFTPGSSFDAHTHDGGEEYLVLEGEFQDETGNFPVGAYVRNPPTSRHTPAASKGAVILVKLHQFDPADRLTVHVDSDASNDPVVALFEDESEQVSIETWEPGQRISRLAPSGMEVFVLEGGCREGDDFLSRWDWLRLPPEGGFEGQAGPEGARVWIKTGHLSQMGEK
ncbi:cupin domain-containing protein [Parasedimentitalea huanghaiensis]|uniref:Cupin n=1 Tax=Parasedimentitalea huanghaiensis TaxID=2682100 RepID=A0A6L6WN39_9RHOB|nr:cupin domain-containing protein [Zongyanglinia huanghaiensis]MVO17417.1 cupin [Zongyanglinia huanghaiensis]